MWPWGHLAFGYALLSVGTRLSGRTPGDRPALVLAFATQLPDLVDKTLSWVLGVLAQGYGPGHSVFVAVPVGALVVALAARRDRLPVGAAFAVGYWSHLVGDVLVALVHESPYVLARVTWPLSDLPPYESRLGALDRASHYFVEWVQGIGVAVVLTYLAVLGAVVALWLADGTPGLFRPWLRER